MYEHDEGLHAAISRRRGADGPASWPFPGRHELHAEIADETPIFHALTVGGWRSRQRGSGRAVRSVHRPTVQADLPGRDDRTERNDRAGRTATTTGAVVAAFHDAEPPVVPVQQRIRARRDADRTADRAAIMHLLGGAGRHRLAPA